MNGHGVCESCCFPYDAVPRTRQGGCEPCAFIARQESNARGSGRSDAWNRFRKRSWSPSIAELTTIREDQTFLRNLSHASAPTSRHAVSQPQSRRRAIATPNIPVGHGNRSLRRLAVSPPGTGCGGPAAACWGAQESANQEQGAWFLGSGALLWGRRPPTLALGPFIPRPVLGGEG